MPMKSEQEYLKFWSNVRSRLARAAQLDPGCLDKHGRKCRLIFGANGHKYSVDPVSEEDIVAFETRYKIKFPTNFRTYMIVIGSSLVRPAYRRLLVTSAGPGYGIMNVIAESISESSPVYMQSPLKPRRGIGFTFDDNEVPSENEYKFEYADVEKGTIEIGTSGNPCIFYLVMNGDAQGDVFGCTTDMLFYEGSFEEWYLKWLDKTMDDLESGAALDKFNRQNS